MFFSCVGGGSKQPRVLHWQYDKTRARAVAVASTAALTLTIASITGVEAKTPGTVHCYGGWCHRINSLDEMDGMVGRRGIVTASYYDDCRHDRFNPCGLTSSGAVFRPDLADNAASPVFPDGTILLTYNPATKLSAVVRVTSAGPYRGDRTLDVSRATAEQLGFKRHGVAKLEVAILKSPDEQEARYLKMRKYAPVPGSMGRFDNFDDAHDAAIAKLRMESAGINLGGGDAVNDFDRKPPEALAVLVPEVMPSATASTGEEAELPAFAGPAILAHHVKEAGETDTNTTLTAEALNQLSGAHSALAEFNQRLLGHLAAIAEAAVSKARSHRFEFTMHPRDYNEFEARLTFAGWTRAFSNASREFVIGEM